jgi:hypothetical protein
LDVCYSAENVCLALNSRRKRGIGFSSAPDPKATLKAQIKVTRDVLDWLIAQILEGRIDRPFDLV